MKRIDVAHPHSLVRALRRRVMEVVAALSILGLSASPASASTVLDVGGSGTQIQAIAAGEAAGVSFTLTSAFSGVSISADVLCIGCTGTFFLLKDAVGPSANLINLIDFASYDVSTSSDPIFTGRDLDAGTYYFFLAVTGQAGAAGWIASDPQTVTAASGAFYNFGVFADALSDTPFRSDLKVIGSTQAMQFRLTTADVVGGAVPEAATWALMILGFGLLGGRLRSIRRTHPILT